MKNSPFWRKFCNNYQVRYGNDFYNNIADFATPQDNITGLILPQPYFSLPICKPSHSLDNSLLTFQSAGWCHSALLFKTSCPHLLMCTPSDTCLDRQSLKLPMTSALKSASAPLCLSCWCFHMKDSGCLFW